MDIKTIGCLAFSLIGGTAIALVLMDKYEEYMEEKETKKEQKERPRNRLNHEMEGKQIALHFSTKKGDHMNIKMLDGESQIKEGKANKSNILGGKGGNLVLTNKRLLFLDHGMNLTQGGVIIDLKDILSVSSAFTFCLFFPIPIPNAIKLMTQDGNVHKFTLFKRKEWISQIINAMNRRDQ